VTKNKSFTAFESEKHYETYTKNLNLRRLSSASFATFKTDFAALHLTLPTARGAATPRSFNQTTTPADGAQALLPLVIVSVQ
jgi:hypothetical protein